MQHNTIYNCFHVSINIISCSTTRSPNLNHKAYSFWLFKVYLKCPKFLFCFSKFQCTSHQQIYVAGFGGKLSYVKPIISSCLRNLFLLILICVLQHPANPHIRCSPTIRPNPNTMIAFATPSNCPTHHNHRHIYLCTTCHKTHKNTEILVQ